MLKKITRWYRGYLFLELCDGSTERFFNLCRKNGIILWNIFRMDGKTFCCMLLEDFWNIRIIAKKTGVWPLIRKKVGFPFWVLRIKKREGMLLGFLSGFFVLYVLSLFLWDISFIGQLSYTEEFLLKYLKTIKVCTGMPLKKVDCKKIEDAIRNSYPEIGWVSAELQGTKLTIHLVETNFKEQEGKREGEYHIVANRDGIIEKLIVRSGVPVVKKGQQVKKGDIIISGVLEYKDDAGNIIKKEAVVADGDVEIKGARTLLETCDLFYKKKTYTGYCKNVVQVGLFHRNLYVTNPFKTFNRYRKYDIISSVRDCKLSKSFVLPISYGSICYREYEEQFVQYKREEATAVLEKMLQQNIKEIKASGGRIVEKGTAVVEQKKNMFLLRLRITTIEPSEELKIIDEEEWRNNQVNGIDRNNIGNTNGT